MNIATAKQQIKNAITVYLQKDEKGQYKIPVVRQRPVFLVGPPGLGKTAIMQQVADEMGIGLVAYSMTHHTRQSALGLPVIVDREFEGTHYQVSEYTMSEILASVYDCMQRTGKREGILFLDEINCVSETLSPAMLLFLQYKVFGGHRVPDGWVIVTAGNPPRFNKSARELDAATRDRLKVMEIPPDYAAFKAYALTSGVARCVISYLDIRQDDFYKVTTQVNGMNVVTPRAWEDLSEMILCQEELGIPVDAALISQYLQDADTARDFALYYQLYQKYKKAWKIDAILEGNYDDQTLEEARQAAVDERITLVGLLLEEVMGRMDACVRAHDDLAGRVRDLKEKKARMDESGASAGERQIWQEERAAVLEERDLLKTDVAGVQKRIGSLLAFLKAAYGRGMELNLAVGDLSVSPRATSFIGQFLSKEYFEESRDLLLHKRKDQLLSELQIPM